MKYLIIFHSIFLSVTVNAQINFVNRKPYSVREEVKTINQKPFKIIEKIYCEKECSENEKDALQKKVGGIYYPNSLVWVRMMDNEKLIKDVKYTIGDYGIRKSKTSSLGALKSKHWILAGDSNIFGEWCSDDETLDASLSSIMPKYSIYNFGKRGGGPHNTLAFMQNFEFKKLITEQEGVFTYTFFPYYMYQRVIGSKNYLAWDKGESPYYALDGSDNLIYKGTFNDRFFFTSFYKFLSSNSFLNKLFDELPRVSESDTNLVAAMFYEMKQSYMKKFPKGKFIVIINNSMARSEDWKTEVLVKNLNQRGVKVEVIPYSEHYNKHRFIDNHIDQEGQRLQADAYVQLLEKYL